MFLTRVLVFFSLLGALCQAGERSVYKIDPYWDGAIIAGGALVTGVPYLLADGLIRKRCPCSFGEVNSFDRPAIGNDSQFGRDSSNVLVTLSLVGPVVLDYFDVGWSRELLEDSVVFAEVVAVNQALVTVVKFAVQRPIPLAYSGQWANLNDGYLSFYSGHTSSTISALAAAAMTANLRHHYGVWPWIGAAAITTAVAIGRVTGGTHFVSDVIVGGLVGAGVGILVPWLHERDSIAAKLTLAPIGSSGAQLVWATSL